MNNFFENLIYSESIRSIVLKLLLSFVVFIFLFVHFYAPSGLCVLIVAT